jgi:simple sugar transport system ATP-binding protein
VLQEKTIISTAAELVDQYSVRTPSVYVNASTLSGGNQQKVIIARELSRPTKLVIASQPTRGLDVGSIEYIHSQIVKKRDEGTAVLLVSPELDEVLALSDRIAVMYKGRIVDVIPAKGANRQYLGLLMAGVPVEEALATTPKQVTVGEVERVF